MNVKLNKIRHIEEINVDDINPFIYAGIKITHGVVVFPKFNNVFLKYIKPVEEDEKETIQGFYIDNNKEVHTILESEAKKLAQQFYGWDYMSELKEKALLDCIIKKEDEERYRPRININEETKTVEL